MVNIVQYLEGKTPYICKRGNPGLARRADKFAIYILQICYKILPGGNSDYSVFAKKLSLARQCQVQTSDCCEKPAKLSSSQSWWVTVQLSSAQLVLNQSTVSWAMHTMLGRLCGAILTLSVISTHVIRRDSVFRGQYMRAFGYGNATKYPPILGKFQDYAQLNLAEVMELPRCAFKDQSYSPLLNITEEQDFLHFYLILFYPPSSPLSQSPSQRNTNIQLLHLIKIIYKVQFSSVS